MKAEQIENALAQKFNTDAARLVFWHDAPGDFADYLKGGLPASLGDVTVLDVGAMGPLAVKLRVEVEDPDGLYLIYSHGEAPAPEEDWLLDVRLYSTSFRADLMSLWMRELGLTDLSLRGHLEARAVFLGSADRRRRLGKLLAGDDDARAVDLKMMAVLVGGATLPTPFEILVAICAGHVKDGVFGLGVTPEVVDALEKMDLSERFRAEMEGVFGMACTTLAALLRRLFVSELLGQAGDKGDNGLGSLAHLALGRAGTRQATVWLTQWRDSVQRAGAYEAVAAAVAAELRIGEGLGSLSAEALTGVMTFWPVEKALASAMKTQVMGARTGEDVEAVRAVATTRRAGYWLAGPGKDAPERKAMAEAWEAMVAAAELFALVESKAVPSVEGGFKGPEALLGAYRDGLYQYDRLYRQFMTRARAVRSLGWDLLKSLSEAVEAAYAQRFLGPLGVAWSAMLEAGFLKTWAAPGWVGQRDFYKTHIRNHLAESDRKRAFVIISDAFRYEAAVDLVEALNGKDRLGAELGAMLGVLPSYTALGMASLLPHKELAYAADGDAVLVDGAGTSGVAARDAVLAKVGGMACRAEDLRAMKTDEARAFTEGKKVVYIYHNIIDARGDHAATEGETFDAVETCIKELLELVRFCVIKLNAAKVWVTADHGFLFQEKAPGEAAKSGLGGKPAGSVKSKKRYVLGRGLGVAPGVHAGKVAETVGAGGDMEFWVPRGGNLFHFVGGARFVHGGAMPQEVVVPVVTVTHLRGETAAKSVVRKVAVQLIGTRTKVTTPRHRFEFIQSEAVDDRRLPLVGRVAVYDGGMAVTSVETVTFDSASDSMSDRKKNVTLTLVAGQFDKTKDYRLLMRDADSEAEVLNVQVSIDRSFNDDF